MVELLKERLNSLHGILKFVATGALNVDYLHRVPQIITDGETEVIEVHREPGGSAANTTYALSAWGITCAFIGCVGDDEDGELLLASFREVGVLTQWIKVKCNARTGRVLGFVDERGMRALYVLPGANQLLSSDDFPIELPRSIEWTHCTSLVGEAQMRSQISWVSKLAKHIKLSFSPGSIYISHGIDALRQFFKRATIAFLTEDELTQLTGCKDIVDGACMLHSLGTAIVSVTMGERGSIVSYEREAILSCGIELPAKEQSHLKDRYGLLERSALPANVVDTTGAGDAFAAGFLLGLVTRMPLDVCHHLACCAASICIERIGARSGTPSLDELIERCKVSYRACR